MKFEIRNRWSGKVQFEAELEARFEKEPYSIQLGAAVELAIKARADLAHTDLTHVDLAGADLEGAYLEGAYLAGADLARANLVNANLAHANLAGADLEGADLARANLVNANLAHANLARANLARANLAGACLAGANLARAYLADANLEGAYLAGAKNAELAMAMTVVAPPEGEVIGWKKCDGPKGETVIVKIKVPADSPRSNAAGRKCRSKFVDVLEVIGAEYGISKHDGKTKYRVGQRVECDSWDENRWNECSGGVHWFITREEAEAY